MLVLALEFIEELFCNRDEIDYDYDHDHDHEMIPLVKVLSETPHTVDNACNTARSPRIMSRNMSGQMVGSA